jgi:hypothetical protein
MPFVQINSGWMYHHAPEATNHEAIVHDETIVHDYVLYEPDTLDGFLMSRGPEFVYSYTKQQRDSLLEIPVGASACNTGLTFWLGAAALYTE